MRTLKRSLQFWVFFYLTGLICPVVFPAVAESDSEVLRTLRENDGKLNTLQATLEIGIPHPAAPLIQWTNALIAYQKHPQAIYFKAHKPLVPVYFILTSSSDMFELFVPRAYTVYHGMNSVFDRSPEIDFKIIPQDLFEIFTVLPYQPFQSKWENLTGTKKLVLKNPNDGLIEEIEFDATDHPKRAVIYNESGYPKLEISRSNWKNIKGLPIAFDIQIKRFLPKPNTILIKFKEIRLNTSIEPNLFNINFPADAKRIELKAD